MPELSNIHPGEILLEEFMKPKALSAEHLASFMAMPRCSIEQLLEDVEISIWSGLWGWPDVRDERPVLAIAPV